MAYKYSYQNFDKETMAKAFGSNLSISLKKSVEVANYIKGKKVSSVINFLERVVEQKAVVPYKRYRAEMPHKRGKGIDSGGYPVNVAKEFLRLIKSAQSNAKEASKDGEMYLISVSARKGVQRYHAGRYFGRKMKATNVEIILGPKKNESKKKSEVKA